MENNPEPIFVQLRTVYGKYASPCPASDNDCSVNLSDPAVRKLAEQPLANDDIEDGLDEDCEEITSSEFNDRYCLNTFFINQRSEDYGIY